MNLCSSSVTGCSSSRSIRNRRCYVARQSYHKTRLVIEASARPSVVITGASTGIGKTTAIYLAEKGWHVFAGVRTDAAAADLASSASSITPVILDVTKPESVSSALQQVQQHVGPQGLMGLVNNAGKGVLGPTEHLPIEAIADVMEVNLMGVIRVTQAFLPLIRQGTPGRIINIGSQAGTVSLPLFTPYSCSKFAVEALSDSLRYELHPQGIKVVLLKPGAVKTPIWDKSFDASEEVVGSLTEEAQQLYATTIKQVKAGARRAESKGVTPEEVAAVIHEALTVEQPRSRYLIGKEAKLQMLFRRLLPDRLWDPLLMGSLSKLG